MTDTIKWNCRCGFTAFNIKDNTQSFTKYHAVVEKKDQLQHKHGDILGTVDHHKKQQHPSMMPASKRCTYT
eukprot:m.80318 g.80318  ORF g.80318 m.80318 type:complete len:71 (-) comp14202_c3_seq1:1158-1370(-)